METTITEFDLSIRYQIYRLFADQCRAPVYQEIAGLLHVAEAEVRDFFIGCTSGI